MAINVVGLFCEDIREEKSGQVTLVGIFPDNVNTPPPPPPDSPPTPRALLIPKLGFYVRINMAIEDDIGPMSVRLILPNGEELEVGTIDAELIAKSKREATDSGLPIAGIVNHAVLQGFRVPSLGIVSGAVDTQGQRYTCAALNFISGRATAPTP